MQKSNIIVIANMILAAILAGLLITYGTPWGAKAFNYQYIFSAAIGLLLIIIALTAIYFRVVRTPDSMEIIKQNLTELSDQQDPEAVYRQVTPVTAGEQNRSVGRGWNRLLATLDGMFNELQACQAEKTMGQFMGSYDSQKLMGAIDCLSDGIVLADNGGIISLANRTCEGMIGRTLGDIFGKEISTLFEDPQAKSYLSHLCECGQGDSNRNFDVTLGQEPDTTVLKVFTRRLTEGRES
ncbi:MAG: PAS domain-containing protein, partial [Phycisphaerae bacterium]|nr:PAS domain-containing protein [Phycisphaerae bacterium]